MKQIATALGISTGAIAALAFASCRGDASTTAPPDPVFRIEKVGGDEQAATVTSELAEPLAVRVLRDDAPAAGQSVVWVVIEGEATLIDGDDRTDASGIAAARLTLGDAAGRVLVRASVAAAGAVEFSSTALTGPPARLMLSAGFAALGVGESLQPTTRVSDAFGNEIGDAEVTLESRSPDVVSASEGSLRGLAGGTAVVVARAGTAADSAAYAVLNPGEVAVAFVDAEGRAFAPAEPDAEVEMRLVVLPTGDAGLAALQGRLSWTGDATYAADRAADDGFYWAANAAQAAAGLLRFAAWSHGAAVDGTILGHAVFSTPAVPGTGILSIDVEVAGDEMGRDVTDRVVPVSTAITAVSRSDP